MALQPATPPPSSGTPTSQAGMPPATQRPLKVLLVNTSSHTGGAAIAALRLLRALHKRGVQARMLCRDTQPEGEEGGVLALKPTLWRKAKFALERAEIMLRNGFSREGLWSVDTARFGNDITRHPAFREADVIHLHWTNQAMLSLADLRHIMHSGKRVVWTMHDMWPFTGICHQSEACTRWLTGCGRCHMLQRPADHDLSAITFARKRKVYAQGRLHMVGCSRWLTDLAQQAPLLQGQPVHCIPNPIDTDFYAPSHKIEDTREALSLPLDKRILFFTAFRVTDPRKGIDYLTEALTLLCQEHPEWREQAVIVLAGKGCEELLHAFPIKAIGMGYITDEAKMRRLYQAADVLLMPTLCDNLPNTIVEAMACGTPCVGFDIGGVPQMIDHGVNGYLAQFRNSLDFAHGIHALLASPNRQALRRNARSKALNTYSERAVADKYLEVYTTP